CRVPLIISQQGVTSQGFCSEIVSNGLDLFPTLCDYAGIEPPAELAGRSLRALAEGMQSLPAREFIPVESEIGRMIVTEDYKYMLFDNGENCEQLYDLKNDPGETKNNAAEPANESIVAKCQSFFTQQFGS
ncbi:MAG TPA: DUF4976 domain-containing protein, partial [Phycisphaerae bacterium]|nr:DUF4976 domain-containing protein [Phycisphaerae bacterium]